MKDKPTITIFTCSYNKPQYVADAINSVLGQTFGDFEYIILENSTDGLTKYVVNQIKDDRIKVIDVLFSEDWRRKFYAESRLKNKYFPKANGKYIMVLSDDDILDPRCFEEHLKNFKINNGSRANHHSYNMVYLESDLPGIEIGATEILRVSGNDKVRTDGGAVMFEKSLIDELSKPLFKSSWGNAHISDGLFVTKVALTTEIYPIDLYLHTKRITKISTHKFISKTDSGEFVKMRQKS